MEMLTWWKSRSEPTPYNSPWASDDDLAALGFALRALRNDRHSSARQRGELHLQTLLAAQKNRPGAAQLLDLLSKEQTRCLYEPCENLMSPPGSGSIVGPRVQGRFTRVYSCKEVVGLLKRQSSDIILTKVKAAQFPPMTADCVEMAGGASPELIQHIRVRENTSPPDGG